MEDRGESQRVAVHQHPLPHPWHGGTQQTAYTTVGWMPTPQSVFSARCLTRQSWLSGVMWHGVRDRWYRCGAYIYKRCQYPNANHDEPSSLTDCPRARVL